MGGTKCVVDVHWSNYQTKPFPANNPNYQIVFMQLDPGTSMIPEVSATRVPSVSFCFIIWRNVKTCGFGASPLAESTKMDQEG
jgi:hypothetical protein